MESCAPQSAVFIRVGAESQPGSAAKIFCFADWCEATIEEKRVRAEYLVIDCQTEIYLSFAERAAQKEHQAVAAMEEGFGLILTFISHPEDDTLLDEAIPFLQEAVRGILEAIELNEECMELDGGCAGTI